ncbi:acetyl/propionyl/methylcrotonyl-CoA carboxylase subunit alpha [Hydrogenophaga sp. PBL-H3]|uniref:acetyl/propionyl/methylcrotonyl-CoA carboxylase subunit alpha n=1 Tax=Hydrogenophaga sp. PBL-H3 TaxID=434010 RepID=UPI0013203312|nr:biotin carboxylase N-terminal domain-containing protein [Hydrogenophaga sp. PBL-H3]QHE75195.1 ATP-grasp domain-containing protein [Hydrogenophaga sp. PBL-H3]QHE79622.1 ATP-grasp domain-containing protein [Hydrogenophaga sp. PBL-H3]
MKRLLIANRGEIARRVIRTAHAMGIQTVAVYADPDRHALHVFDATTAFALGGTTSAESYLCVDRLIEAARATGADAVHPGYGFLSENADFAQAVIDAGLTWVGPPPAAIHALGSKSAAKALALSQGVPCLPGYFGADQREDTLVAEAQRVGFPLMVKAVAGGGGRGMRLVLDASQLLPALRSARSEALSGFGNGDLLIERALLRPRHVEVQVFADAHGHCVHLGERDCSVQRRHQKIIEEAPSPAVSPALREELGHCAVALAQAAGYVGAGTVEFLLEGSAFHLMEMNTRLQVEHPVTEALTGLDLVEWQLRVARGEPLPLTQEQITFQGHAIEVRLCAEDDHHTPHTGRVGRFTEPPTVPGLRFDHALENGSEVTPHFDSMLGKLIAHAATRAEAIDRLAHALDHTQVLGLPTNRAFLAACLRHPVFGAGDALIPFLAEHGEDLRSHLAAQRAPGQPALVVAMLAVQHAAAPPASSLAVPFTRPLRFGLPDAVCSLDVQELGAGQLRISHGETTHSAHVEALAGGQLRVLLDDRQWLANAVLTAPGRWHVQVQGAGATVDGWLTELSHHPAQRAGGSERARELRAPFNGKLIAVHAQPGNAVAKGAPLLVIESMKLEHTLSAPRDLTVESLSVAAGQQVAPGQLLITFAA